MKNTKEFIDPYKGYEGRLVRLQTWVSKDDHDAVTTVRPTKGTIQVVNNILWSRFVKAMKRTGIKDISDLASLEQFTMSFEIVVPKNWKGQV